MTGPPPLRLDLLIQLAALGSGGSLPAPVGARALGAGGGTPVFSDFVAPSNTRKEQDRPGSLGGTDGVGDQACAERAAILEFEGGWPRSIAEAIAARVVGMLIRDASPDEWAAFDRELIAAEAARSHELALPRCVNRVNGRRQLGQP